MGKEQRYVFVECELLAQAARIIAALLKPGTGKIVEELQQICMHPRPNTGGDRK